MIQKANHIKGITVTLIEDIQAGEDPFGYPITFGQKIDVENVLVSPTSSKDIIDQMNLYGKKAEYILAIPKGDTNDWEDKEIIFFDKRWRTFGFTIEGIEELIPLEWNKKVYVERYE